MSSNTSVSKVIDKRNSRSASTRIPVCLSKTLALVESTGAELSLAVLFPDSSFVTLSTGKGDWKKVADDIAEGIDKPEAVGLHFDEDDAELITAKSRHRYKELDDEVNKMKGPKVLWNAFPGNKELKQRLLPQLQARWKTKHKKHNSLSTVGVEVEKEKKELDLSCGLLPPASATSSSSCSCAVKKPFFDQDRLDEVPMGILHMLFP